MRLRDNLPLEASNTRRHFEKFPPTCRSFGLGGFSALPQMLHDQRLPRRLRALEPTLSSVRSQLGWRVCWTFDQTRDIRRLFDSEGFRVLAPAQKMACELSDI